MASCEVSRGLLVVQGDAIDLTTRPALLSIDHKAPARLLSIDRWQTRVLRATALRHPAGPAADWPPVDSIREQHVASYVNNDLF